MTASEDLTLRQIYANFAIYYPHRTEPIITRFVDDPGIREALFPGVDAATVRQALREAVRLAQSESWRQDWDSSVRIQDYIAQE